VALPKQNAHHESTKVRNHENETSSVSEPAGYLLLYFAFSSFRPFVIRILNPEYSLCRDDFLVISMK